jgi:hypothetical protein
LTECFCAFKSSVKPGQVLYASVNGTLYPELPDADDASLTSDSALAASASGPYSKADRKLDKKIEKTDKKIEKLERKMEKLELKKTGTRQAPEPERASHPDPRVQANFN